MQKTTASAAALRGSSPCVLRQLAVAPRPGMPSSEQLGEHVKPLSISNLCAPRGSAVV